MSVARFALAWATFVAWTFAVFTLLEAAVPRRRARVPWRAIAIGGALLATDTALTRWLASTPPPATAARTAGAWLAAELVTYGVHRAMHRVPVLWRFHRLHHVDEPLAWPIAWRSHPIDAALFTLAISGTGWLVGAPLPAVAGFVIARRIWTILLHANVAWPASWLDRVVATPNFHHRHHREDLAAANFASTLPAIDRVFGTWARGE